MFISSSSPTVNLKGKPPSADAQIQTGIVVSGGWDSKQSSYLLI